MVHNGKDLRRKTVIDINTAEILGTVCDIDVDLGTGRINSIILPPKEIFSGLFSKNRERVIPWQSVKAVGREYILVDYSELSELLP